MQKRYKMKDPEQERRLYLSRALFAFICVLLVSAGLLWRYYDLQINRYEVFVTQSEKNRVHVRSVPPSRGLIYDRNGVLLADNKPNFTLSIVKEQAGEIDRLIADLRQLVDISDNEITDFKKLLQRTHPYEPVTLLYNVSEKEQAILAVNAHRLTGVDVTALLSRYYPLHKEMAHVVGYVGRINDRDVKRLDSVAYSGTNVVGKRGLEQFYEQELLGIVGSENVETNSRGRVMRVLERIDPQPGQDLQLFVDSRLQRIAIQAMAGELGSLVAIDTRSGGVLAMVSTPSYDPNLFVTGISYKDYGDLTQSADKPLLNRSVQGLYPPGSTVKPVYALAVLETGVVNKYTHISDPGFYRLPNEKRKYRDWKRRGHGNHVDLRQAIEESCDVYFYKACYKMGIDRLGPYGETMGLGQTTGIDLSGEKAGIMPTRAWKKGARGQDWYPGDTLNTSIGQGFTLMTPLQMAVMTSRIANRGVGTSPRLVKAINGQDVSIEPPMEYIKASAASWNSVHDGMVAVVHGLKGTAKQIGKNLTFQGHPYKIAGKTGTAQVVGIAQDAKYDAEIISKSNRDHKLFIAFAPADKPRIAIAVIVENGEHGAAPIARKVIDAFLEYEEESAINLGTGVE
jgi:penicillin-binding protein 2